MNEKQLTERCKSNRNDNQQIILLDLLSPQFCEPAARRVSSRVEPVACVLAPISNSNKLGDKGVVKLASLGFLPFDRRLGFLPTKRGAHDLLPAKSQREIR